ncbi:hypothetical protein [Actinacidiphila rubida]|uniref:Uncharacterized protein n=1 Tax=Actinacidiphila rubida TaxID=310780 RepID=A0A1H8MXQ0_9ACTN|nr:hypothetical protein [Actinacidiphila rubida]SEO22036.1 hypothetical protein SAMN05216267_102065 [Actinacidiphila rubida]
MRFSEIFSLSTTSEDDWFDTFLPSDTKLFIDPFLIWEEKEGHWTGAHGHLIDFFEMVFGLVKESDGDEKGISWKQAQKLLLFPEPYEFCLGVAEGSPHGSGSGKGLQSDMLEGVKVATGLGINRIAHMEMLNLFQGGMGVDRLSDMTCNILKSYFISYTQQVAQRHGIKGSRVTVANATWDSEFCRWKSGVFELPINPYINKPVLLTPERFLRQIPVATPDGFWSYAWSTASAELRGDLTFDIARNVGRREKAKLARQNPDVVALYLNALEEEEKKPYSISDDPGLVVKWYELGSKIARESPLRYIPEEPEDFESFIATVVASYKHGIEEQDAWQLLWHDGHAREERAGQALFRSSVIHYCRANNIDLTGESNAGRGPVDFKFSQGWDSRALVEIKLVRNSKFWDGVLAQQPQYQVSEEVNCGFFVAIGYTDAHCAPEIKEKIDRAAALVTKVSGKKITGILVDARPKKSASKLHNPELSEELKRGESDPSPEEPASD